MNQETWNQIQKLFEAGLPLDSGARKRLLLEHCTGRPEVSVEVEQLWDNCDEEDPVFAFEGLPELTRNLFLSTGGNFSTIPKVVNSYLILETIAHGGMGTVYKARQQRPIERIVALKILPPEFKAGEYLHRFQAEQRALGLMAHPNVAAVFDAGVTMDERPFFAMEHLPSTTLTGYCDCHRLSIRERLRLFLQVCDGVQHAHQKGIIHRDLKPANILVVEVDGRPVAKIIDFGIAKFLDQTLLATPLKTRAGAVIGTPAYMSPEQAEGGEQQVDTRSDVYALGVLLYQLMVGVTPFEIEGNALDSFAEVRRLLREGAVVRPSVRVRENEDVFARAAEQRQTDSAGLRQQLRGELDWLITKAMAREAEDRYQSCSELAEDLRRYLGGLPLLAAPAGNLYTLKTFVRRHKRAVMVAGVIAFLLVAGLTGTSMALFRALRAENRARTALETVQAVNDFSVGIFDEAGPYRSGGKVTGEEILKIAAQKVGGKYQDRLEIQAATRLVLGRSFIGLGLIPESSEQLESAIDLRRQLFGEDDPSTLEAKEVLAYVLTFAEDFSGSEQLYRECLDGFTKHFGPDDPRALRAAGGLANVFGKIRRYERAIALFEKTLMAQKRVLGNDHVQTLITQNGFANILIYTGRYAEAEILHRQTLISNQKIWDEDTPTVLTSRHNMAYAIQEQGRYAEAEAIYQEILPLRRKILAADHHATLKTLSNLAAVINDQGRAEEAVNLLREGLPMDRINLGQVVPSQLPALHNLGNSLMESDQYQEAARVLELTYRERLVLLGEGNPKALVTRCTQAQNLQKRGELERAQSMFREVVETARNYLGSDDPNTLIYQGLWGWCLAEKGKPVEGSALLEESHRKLSALDNSRASMMADYLRRIEDQKQVN